MIDLLVFGDAIVTMDGSQKTIQDGGVAIDAGKIVDVEQRKVLKSGYRAKRELDLRRQVILPGLIDTHGHAGHGLVKTLGNSLDNEKWGKVLNQLYMQGTRKSFWIAEAKLAALERIKFGVTCGVSFLGGGAGAYRSDDPGFASDYANASAESGLRSLIALGPSGPAFPLKTEKFRTKSSNGDKDTTVTFEEAIENTRQAIHLVNGRVTLANVRVSVNRVAPMPGDLSDNNKVEFLNQAKKVRELADETNTGILAHAYGGMIGPAKDANLLGADVLLAHCTGVTEEEISILANTKTNVSHCPRSRAAIAARCPVTELQSSSVTVGLGTDGPAPDRSFNMFDDMRMAMALQAAHFRDYWALAPVKALQMATIDAAKSVGLKSELGSIEPGKKADLIAVDMFKPHIVPIYMIPSRLVHEASGFDVSTVIVDGKIVMENRAVTTLNEEEILSEAQREAEKAVTENDLGALISDAAFWSGR